MPQSPEQDMQVEIMYTNHRGVTSRRNIIPQGGGFEFGVSQWHRTPQWLLHAYDLDKKAQRTFAMADVQGWNPVHLAKE